MRNYLIVILTVLFAGFTQISNGDSRVFAVLNVGQGDSSVFIYDDFTMVVDTGYDMQSIWELDRVIGNGDRDIDVLVITHNHFDHYGGVLQMLDRYDIGQIWVSKGCKDIYWWLKSVEIEGIEVKSVGFGDEYIADGFKVAVMAPFGEIQCTGSGTVVNNSSIVLELSVNDVKILLMGDAEKASEIVIDVGKVDILKAGHHCSDTSSTQAFIEKIHPFVAICSVGENSYGHPSNEVIERFHGHNIRIHRTDLDGNYMYYF